ncbi:MAG: Ig-like domain-containing protein [Gemmatimonadetes bacterium]|nr:Ig-like domain-containing protein [Gemmatimonadota bacterium]
MIMLVATLACGGGGGDGGSGPSGGDPGPFEGTWVVTFSDLTAGTTRCVLPSATFLLNQPATSVSGALTADGDGFCDADGVIYQGRMPTIPVPAFAVPSDTLRILQPQRGVTITGRVVGDSMGGTLTWQAIFGNFTSVAELSGTWSARRLWASAPAGTMVRVRYPETAITVFQTDSVLAPATAQDRLGNIVAPPGFTYTTFDPLDAASASPAGYIRAAGPLGIFRVRAEAGGMRGEAAVAVLPSPDTIVVTPDSLVMERYNFRSLSAVALDYAGAPMPNLPITYVAGPGGLIEITPGTSTVHSLGVTGTTTVTVWASRRFVVVPVRVNATVATIGINALPFTLAPGASQILTATVRDPHAIVIPGAPVTWSSSAPAVADVAQDGTVTAATVGSARITATARPGVSTFVDVTVQ